MINLLSRINPAHWREQANDQSLQADKAAAKWEAKVKHGFSYFYGGYNDRRNGRRTNFVEGKLGRAYQAGVEMAKVHCAVNLETI